MIGGALAGRQVGLALSGGGTRAMAFHAGVLRYLAEAGILACVTHISSVSGGSLLTGLIFKLSGWNWPAGTNYSARVFPEIRRIMTETDLGACALRGLMVPTNWKYFLSRANMVAEAIERLWSIDARLVDLPATPVWSVNATTSETGRRFRFKETGVGDYELGYAAAAAFKVADAMAVSAAFPGVIGPFVIETARYDWRKRETWDLPKDEEAMKEPPFERLHLYDGGIYDNLGTEPLFDSGKQCQKDGTDFIMVSDAGAPLGRIAPGWFRPFRLKRVADIMGDQTRALRVRSFVHFLQRHPKDGAYIQIGAVADEKVRTYSRYNPAAAEALLRNSWIGAGDVARAAGCRTTLRRMSQADFDLLERHGYETAKWNIGLFC